MQPPRHIASIDVFTARGCSRRARQLAAKVTTQRFIAALVCDPRRHAHSHHVSKHEVPMHPAHAGAIGDRLKY